MKAEPEPTIIALIASRVSQYEKCQCISTISVFTSTQGNQIPAAVCLYKMHAVAVAGLESAHLQIAHLWLTRSRGWRAAVVISACATLC